MAPMRIHFESLTDRPVFHIDAQRVERLADAVPALHGARISRGEDLLALDALRDTEVLITSEFVLAHPRFPLRRLAAAAPALRWIHVTNAGIEKLLPLDWLPAGVVMTNSSGAHASKAREYACMALLMLHCGMPRMIGNQAARRWEKVHTPGMPGKRLCIVGAGRLGEAFAEEGKRLGLEVLGVRRSGEPRPHFDRMFAPARLQEALRDSDFVAVCLPLTPETAGMIGAREFAWMKPGAGFINVGRGKVVDYEALGAALASGHLDGAIADVFPQEPLPADSPVWGLPRLVMTPHVAMDDADHFLDRCLDIAMDNLAQYRAGRPLRNVIDPTRGY